MKNPIFPILLLLFCGLSSLSLCGQESYSSVEEAVSYINEIFSENEHSDKYKIASVGNNLIEIKLISSRSKDAVEALEKEDKSINDYPAFKVLSKKVDGSVITESKSAMVINSMKKFMVKIDQSNPYPDTKLIYFQNIQMLSWDYLNSIWSLSTWNYCSFSFEGSQERFDDLYTAWKYLISEVVKRED